MPAVSAGNKSSTVAPSDPRIRRRECLVHRFLNMIENHQPYCCKHNDSDDKQL